MPHDPSTPPEAELAKPALAPTLRPAAVGKACQLVIASLALGLVTLLPGVHGDRPDEPPTPALVSLLVLLFFGGLTVWLAQRTYQGRNWARWLLLAYLILGWGVGGAGLTEDFQYSPVSGLINIVCIALEAAAAWLLFTGRGGAWFTRR